MEETSKLLPYWDYSSRSVQRVRKRRGASGEQPAGHAERHCSANARDYRHQLSSRSMVVIPSVGISVDEDSGTNSDGERENRRKPVCAFDFVFIFPQYHSEWLSASPHDSLFAGRLNLSREAVVLQEHLLPSNDATAPLRPSGCAWSSSKSPNSSPTLRVWMTSRRVRSPPWLSRWTRTRATEMQ